jgi:hypothetical protein
MLFVESSGETKVGQFDMAITVQKDIVGFYISLKSLALSRV